MKTCTKCKQAKYLSEFHKDPSMGDGLQSACKPCGQATSAAYRAANKDKVNAINAAWHAANPEKARITSQNRRARKRASGGKLSQGLAERLFILQKGKCPCCKQPLGNNYHLDHIMPLSLGGANTDSNIQLLRSTCNLQKHAAHPIAFMQARGYLL